MGFGEALALGDEDGLVVALLDAGDFLAAGFGFVEVLDAGEDAGFPCAGALPLGEAPGLDAAVGGVAGGVSVGPSAVAVGSGSLADGAGGCEPASAADVAARAAVPQAVAVSAPAAASAVPPLTTRHPRERRCAVVDPAARRLRAWRGSDGLTGWLSAAWTPNSRVHAWRENSPGCR